MRDPAGRIRRATASGGPRRGGGACPSMGATVPRSGRPGAPDRPRRGGRHLRRERTAARAARKRAPHRRSRCRHPREAASVAGAAPARRTAAQPIRREAPIQAGNPNSRTGRERSSAGAEGRTNAQGLRTHSRQPKGGRRAFWRGTKPKERQAALWPDYAPAGPEEAESSRHPQDGRRDGAARGRRPTPTRMRRATEPAPGGGTPRARAGQHAFRPHTGPQNSARNRA